ncbi:MAG: hypothetical protein ACKPAC_04955, partial [Alphaproteobacteria bacterium]
IGALSRKRIRTYPLFKINMDEQGTSQRVASRLKRGKRKSHFKNQTMNFSGLPNHNNNRGISRSI